MKKKSFRNLLTSVDVLNTLNGGVSEPRLSVLKKTEGHQMRVRVAGLDKEALEVEIHNNELSIFYYIEIETNGKTVRMPQVIYSQPIPYFISADGITASYDDKYLVVDLPFNEKANGYHRKVETR